MKLKYNKVSVEVFEKLKAVMSKIGVDITGDKGDISAKGIKGSFHRDPENGDLVIQIDKTPMLLPSSFIANKITSVITENGGEAV